MQDFGRVHAFPDKIYPFWQDSMAHAEWVWLHPMEAAFVARGHGEGAPRVPFVHVCREPFVQTSWVHGVPSLTHVFPERVNPFWQDSMAHAEWFWLHPMEAAFVARGHGDGAPRMPFVHVCREPFVQTSWVHGGRMQAGSPSFPSPHILPSSAHEICEAWP